MIVDAMNHLRLGLGLIIFTLIALAVSSCEEQRIIYDGPDYVRFTDTSLVYKESYGKIIPIKIHLVGKPSETPINVTYSVSGTAVDGRDYRIIGEKGSVSIPAGAYFGEIELELINNSNNILRSSEILFTINAVSRGEEWIQVGTGKNLSIGNSLRFVIEDDCLYGGYYNATRAGSTRVEKDVAITSSNCVDYILSNWNIDLMRFNADRLTLHFKDNGDNSITIPVQYNTILGDSLMGNGAWDPRTREILLNITIKTQVNSGADTLISLPPLTYVPR